MKRILGVLLLIGLLLPACGYRFSGGGSLPGGAETISVLMLENRTAEIGIQTQLTGDISYEVTRRDSTRIARPGNADAVLSGVVRTIQDTDIAHTGTSTASQRRVTLTVDMQLKRPDGTVLWRRSGFSDYEAYDVASDRNQTDLNRKSAVEKLSKRLAERIYKSITDNF
jgi:outer membrane lipopolysaccharide assembly protein LptE/RlpB